MDPSLAALLGGALGALLTGAVVVARQMSGRALPAAREEIQPVLPPGLVDVLSVLPSSAVVLGERGDVLKASAPAQALGVVRGNRLAVPELRDLVAAVRRDGQIRDGEMELGQASATGARHLWARVAPLSSRLVLLLVEDRTPEHRKETIRRDFVANVSHELKTPVGAIALLAEAVAEAVDDPEAVQRFAARMRGESVRLGRLVQQIIELSRLQADDPLAEVGRLEVESVVERAIDPGSVDAEAKRVQVVWRGKPGLYVQGNLPQLSVALSNLVENAVAYSPAGSAVVIDARVVDGWVEISVTDQGVGIPADEVDRIFERFYRLDPARSRSTGGTGLGLSIVKHVAASHGGEVKVWSAEGQGSSFTLRLPATVGERVNSVLSGTVAM